MLAQQVFGVFHQRFEKAQVPLDSGHFALETRFPGNVYREYVAHRLVTAPGPLEFLPPVRQHPAACLGPLLVAARPRLAVFRSNKHLSVQVIDDDLGVTLAAASTTETDLRSASGASVDAAAKIGQLVADRSKAAGITTVVFDRGGFAYHGRIAAVASAARDAGLEF